MDPFEPTTDTGPVDAPHSDVELERARELAPARSATGADPYEEPAETPAPAQQLRPGTLVEHTYFDAYSGAGGEEVTRQGLVIQTGDEGARVFWIDQLSDPIATDQLTAL
jgi:hypothetical protein